MQRILLGGVAMAACLACAPAGATILTFDAAPGVGVNTVVPQAYGDNVTASPDGAGHSYGVGAEGFTPNVSVAYGAGGEESKLYPTGYGDLTNVYFNELDHGTSLTATFTADAGYLIDLYGFDMAAYENDGETVTGLTVFDGSDGVLFSQGATFISGATHTSFAFATPLRAAELRLVVDLTGLERHSDEFALDNIRFGQTDAPSPSVGGIPEPASWALMIAGFGMAGAFLRRRPALGPAC
jgi:hypothetical protein